MFIFQLISVLISWNFLINVKKMLHRLLLTVHWLELVSNETNTCFYKGLLGKLQLAINVSELFSVAI